MADILAVEVQVFSAAPNWMVILFFIGGGSTNLLSCPKLCNDIVLYKNFYVCAISSIIEK